MPLDRQQYEDYIQSSAWDARRKRALRLQGKRCQACDTHGDLHVHHHTYERFMHERDDDLVVLCQSCHRRVHAFHKGTHLTLTEATFTYLKMAHSGRDVDGVVNADHTPPVAPLPPRTDGKRVVSMDRRARGGHGWVDLGPKAIHAPHRRPGRPAKW